jgi:hypothetical protein
MRQDGAPTLSQIREPTLSLEPCGARAGLAHGAARRREVANLRIAKQVRNYVVVSTEWTLQTTDRLNNRWVVGRINRLVVLGVYFRSSTIH